MVIVKPPTGSTARAKIPNMASIAMFEKATGLQMLKGLQPPRAEVFEPKKIWTTQLCKRKKASLRGKYGRVKKINWAFIFKEKNIQKIWMFLFVVEPLKKKTFFKRGYIMIYYIDIMIYVMVCTYML